MLLFPAIDLYDQQIVRLRQGDFAQRQVYGKDPFALAEIIRDTGFTHLHVVDLQGAREGTPRHLALLNRIAALGLHVQYGGGLRTTEAIQNAVDAGAWRVMLGSVLLSGNNRCRQIVARFGERILPSLDVKGELIATEGWRKDTKTRLTEVIPEFLDLGTSSFLITSILHDGMRSGPNVELYKRTLEQYSNINIVAAGGIHTDSDLARLRETGVSGAVAGTALFEGTITSFKTIRRMFNAD